MFCSKCNTELPDGARVCYSCHEIFALPGETEEQARDRAGRECWELIKRAQLQALQGTGESAAIEGGVSQMPAMRSDAARADEAAASGLAIASLVMGIIAIATSFMPIVNNWSFIVAIVGLALAIAGIVGTGKGKKKGRGMAVAGIVLAVASAAIVLASQWYYSSALQQFAESLTSGQKPVEASSADVDYSNMAIGQDVKFEDGLIVRVNEVEMGLASYDGSPMTRVSVTYENSGSANASFNMLDWRSENADGVMSSPSFFGTGDADLGSGGLAPGGTVTGNVYFEGNIVKVYYYSNVFVQDGADICWVV